MAGNISVFCAYWLVRLVSFSHIHPEVFKSATMFLGMATCDSQGLSLLTPKVIFHQNLSVLGTRTSLG